MRWNAAHGDSSRAAEFRAKADRARDAIRKHCWVAEKGLYADDGDRTVFSQHMNVFAVLYDIATPEEAPDILERITVRGRGIDAPAGMYSPTYYFAWYLVRAFEHAGLAERYFELLQSWRDLLAFNYTTWPETREQPRSDTHAWSAHPTADLLRIVAGIRSGADGYARVRIEPLLGSLTSLEATAATPEWPRQGELPYLGRQADRHHRSARRAARNLRLARQGTCAEGSSHSARAGVEGLATSPEVLATLALGITGEACMRVVLMGTAVLWIAGAGLAQADENNNPLDSTLVLDVGGFFLSTDINVRLDGETTNQVGDEIDFDDTFGIADFERFRMDALWRIKGKHSLRGTYFTNNRASSNELSRDIDFGDETYPVGATVSARSELEVLQLSYDYVFKRRENYELAGGIGVHMLNVSLGLNATVTSGGGSAQRELSERGTTAAPLPTLGFRGVWRLPNNFYVTALAQYFYIDFDNYVGSLSDVKATLVWQASEHVGVGLGYNDFRFRLKLDKDRFDGRLGWDYGGAMAFVSVTY